MNISWLVLQHGVIATSFTAFMQNTEIIDCSHAVDCECSVLIEILDVVCQISAEIPLD